MSPNEDKRPGPFWERGRVQRWVQFLSHDIWLIELGSLPRFRALAYRASRVLLLTARGFRGDRLMLQAGAMTYVTVLSIVPLLACAFSVAKGLGAYDKLREEAIVPFLDDTFGEAVVVDGHGEPVAVLAPPEEDPAGGEALVASTRASQLRSAIDRLLASVERANTGALGTIGLLILLYAAIRLIGAVERSLNEIWGVKSPRAWGRRISNHIAIMVVTPILLMVGTAATATLRAVRFVEGSIFDFGRFMAFTLELMPLAAICLGLSFLYLALPNTNVRWRSALIGGVAAGMLWYFGQSLHFGMQIGVARFDVLYSGFAALPIFLMWVFFSWVVILLGAELAFSHQNVSLYTSIARTGTVDHALKEALALRLCGRITDAFLRGQVPLTAPALAKRIGVSPRAVTQVLAALAEQGIVVQTSGSGEDGYLPARDPETITVRDVLQALKVEQGATRAEARERLDHRADRILAALDRELADSLHNHTLRELASAAREGEEEVSLGGLGQPRGAESPSVG